MLRYWEALRPLTDAPISTGMTGYQVCGGWVETPENFPCFLASCVAARLMRGRTGLQYT